MKSVSDLENDMTMRLGGPRERRVIGLNEIGQCDIGDTIILENRERRVIGLNEIGIFGDSGRRRQRTMGGTTGD